MAGLQTVLKLGPVLDLFTTDQHTWGVTEAAEALDIPRSSAHSLLSSLVEIGLLQARGRGRYSIGWRVLELSEVLKSRSDLRIVAAPVLDDLVRQQGETAHLAVIERMSVLYIDKVMGTHNIVVQGARVGARLETYCTAVGKLLLAYVDREVVEDFFRDRPLRRFTPTTITELPDLMAALEEIRRTGVSYDMGEQVPDIRCVAVPVRDEMGAVVAALSLSVPLTRYNGTQSQLVAAVRQSATDIQRRLADALDDSTPGVGTPDVREVPPSRR